MRKRTGQLALYIATSGGETICTDANTEMSLTPIKVGIRVGKIFKRPSYAA